MGRGLDDLRADAGGRLVNAGVRLGFRFSPKEWSLNPNFDEFSEPEP